eukprot:COSAG06_NODE_2587_length_6615_cov_25.876918_2_plen_238_part_00
MDSIIETVGNALGEGDGALHAKVEAELAADSDAVVSPLPPEQAWIGRVLSREADGRPSVAFRGLQVVVVIVAIMNAATSPDAAATGAGMRAPNDLHYVTAMLHGLSHAMLLLTVGSARVALQPSGALEQLGVAVQMISAKETASLARWRAFLVGLTTLCVVSGLNNFYMAIVNEGWLVPPGGYHWPGRLYLVVFGLHYIAIVPVIAIGWWASMCTACTLCRDDITEVRLLPHTSRPV